MILAEVRDYVRQRGRVSLADLVHHFDSSPDAMRGMLDQWVRRGKVRRLESANRCQGCTQDTWTGIFCGARPLPERHSPR